MAFTVKAFICCYNEADIIGWVIDHLLMQGVEVHVIDNWSNDDSPMIVARATDRSSAVTYERFPVTGAPRYYSWRHLLSRVEELAEKSGASWCIHHDADEIRRSPRAGETLLKAFQRVDAEGYNAVNHRVFHFMPVDDGYVGDPESHFHYYTEDHGDCKIRQIKAWKNMGQRVNLHDNGGHCAQFDGMRVSPEQFVLKHYPLRTSAQAERKVLHERMARYDPVERAMGWHIQYNGLAQSRSWLSSPQWLKEWKEDAVPV